MSLSPSLVQRQAAMQEEQETEQRLLHSLDTVVAVIHSDECADLSLSAEEIQQRVTLSRNVLREVLAYCDAHPAGFAGEEEALCLLLLPVLQCYGVCVCDESENDLRGESVCGLCCAVLCVLLEHSLQAIEEESFPQTETESESETPTESERETFLAAHALLLSRLAAMGWVDSLLSQLFAHIESAPLVSLLAHALSLLVAQREAPEENCVLFAQSDGCEAVVEALTLHGEDAALALQCVELLALLVERSSEIREQLGTCGVCEALTEALRISLSHCAPFAEKKKVMGDERETERERERERERDSRSSSISKSYEPPSLHSVLGVAAASSPSSLSLSLASDRERERERDRESERDSAANKSPAEIAFFVSTSCVLISRLCVDCAENQRLFGESDACDVLLDALLLFTPRETHTGSAHNALSQATTAETTLSFTASTDESERETAALCLCCDAVGALCESHDENAWKFGRNGLCLSLVRLLRVRGAQSCDVSLCASRALRRLIECSESNKQLAGVQGRLGELLVSLLRTHIATAREEDRADDAAAAQSLCALLATLLQSSLSEKTELSVGRQVSDCGGGVLLVDLLLSHATREDICSHALAALASLLSVLEQENNEVAMEDVLHSGAVAAVRETLSRFRENEEVLEFGELVLAKLASRFDELLL